MNPTRRFDPISKEDFKALLDQTDLYALDGNSDGLTTAYEIFGAKLKLSYDTVFPLKCNKTRSSTVNSL